MRRLLIGIAVVLAGFGVVFARSAPGTATTLATPNASPIVASPRAGATTDPVAALQTQVAGLIATVSVQATEIADLETRVAATPESTAETSANDQGTGTISGARAATKPAGDTYSISGNITLTDDDSVYFGNSTCYGLRGYQDMHVGTGATVRDGTGTVLGTGSIYDAQTIGRSCVLYFKIEELPRSDFYSVEVSHRGELVYSFDELESMDWNIELSLGF